MEEFDKEKSCNGCPDRYPGCHDDCTGYKKRCAKNDRIKAERRKEIARRSAAAETAIRLKKITKGKWR